ncbi:MAG: phosphatase PAP2 family protein [Anaerolineales bacterium]|nr:phosphatase PAP2 family protein [Anaerolineales bacterium]
MTTPLDHHADNRTGTVRAARLFSNIVSPPVIFAVVGLLLAVNAMPTLPQALFWAALYGFMVSLLPILFVLWLLKTGRVAELHMSNTKERTLPYIVAVLSAAVLYAIVWLIDGPEFMKCLALFNMVTLSILGVINSFWLISFHATAITAAWAIIFLTFGRQASLIVAVLVVLVVIVRLYLKRHTFSQIIAGIALGISSVLLLTEFGCFV